MSYPKVIKLRAWGPVLEGVGEKLTLKVEAYRPSRTEGRWGWRGPVELELDRFIVRQLATQIKEMQKRDLDRLAAERARLDYEVEPIQKPGNSQEA